MVRLWVCSLQRGREILNPFDDAQDRLEFSMTMGAGGKLLLD